MSSLEQTNNSERPMVEAYQRPYHNAVDARLLLLALGQLALINVWPFRDTPVTEPAARFDRAHSNRALTHLRK